MKDKNGDFDTDERFMSMDADSRTITGLFMEGDKVEAMQKHVEGIAKAANEHHREECNSKEHCHGVMPYALRYLKSFLIIHPELTEMERLAVVGSLMFSMGATTADESEDDLPADMPEPLKRMMRNGQGIAMPMPPNFGKFMADNEKEAKKLGMPLAEYMAEKVMDKFFKDMKDE